MIKNKVYQKNKNIEKIMNAEFAKNKRINERLDKTEGGVKLKDIIN